MKIKIKPVPVGDLDYGSIVYINNLNDCGITEKITEKIYIILDAEKIPPFNTADFDSTVILASLETGEIFGTDINTEAIPINTELSVDIRNVYDI